MKSSEKLVIAKTRIDPGQVLDIRLKISETYTGDPIAIPLRVVRASKAGPTLFICAAVHGNELSGTGVVHELMFQKTLQLTKGTVILIPVVNVFGFESNRRNLPDRRDLNRCFPGNLKGSLAGRIAATFMREIIRKCDYGIDLHSAAQQRTNYPNVRGDCSLPAVKKIARAFGSELIVPNTGPMGSLRRSACRARCYTITVEAGAPSKMASSVIEFGVQGVENVLIELGMLEGSQQTPLYQAHLKKTTWVRAQVGGILRFHILPGDLVESGQAIATNYGILGDQQNVLKSPVNGLVLGMATMPTVKPGEPVCHLGIPTTPLAKIRKSLKKSSSSSLHGKIRRQLAADISYVGR
ncbi:succinylglutamate desuccinylase/aspartoacylase family protein [bacterium]|nr:succinylglutamate desuccinylase/aspartoacylase family protein [bacterium]